MSIPAANGHAPAAGLDLTAPIEEISGELMAQPDPQELSIERIEDDLTALLEPIRDKRAELEVQVLELSAQEDRIAAAIQALGGVKPRRGPGRPPGPSRPAKRLKDSKGWVPSEDSLDRVRAVLRAATEPMSVTQIAETINGAVSGETVNRSIRYLRENEEIRLTGTGPYNARLFQMMES